MQPFSRIVGLQHVLFFWDTVISPSENTDDAGTFSQAAHSLQAKSHHSHYMLHQHFIRWLNKDEESCNGRPLCLHTHVESASKRGVPFWRGYRVCAVHVKLAHESTDANRHRVVCQLVITLQLHRIAFFSHYCFSFSVQ